MMKVPLALETYAEPNGLYLIIFRIRGMTKMSEMKAELLSFP